MKILVVSQHYWPESFRITNVVRSLVLEGCGVSVLTGQPNYPGGSVFSDFKAWHMGSSRHAEGYVIHRVPIIPRGSGSAWRLAANYLSFILSASTFGVWLLRRERFDVVFVYGTSPILQAIPAVLFRRFKHAALVTWVQDLWPQSLEATGFVKHPLLLSAIERVVRWIYGNNDLLLVQSPAFLQPVSDIAGATPVEFHPNPGERESVVAGDAPAWHLPTGFNVVFAGNLGTVQALDTVLVAAEMLIGHEDVRFILIGSGSRGAWIESQTVERGLRNVVLPGRFPSEAMPAILAQASALLVSLVRSKAMSQTIPSKLQAYLAAAKPIIGSLDGEGARVLTEAQAGLACPPEDARALADCVLQLRATPASVLAQMGASGRRYYEAHFDPDMLGARMAQRLAALGRPGKSRCMPVDPGG